MKKKSKYVQHTCWKISSLITEESTFVIHLVHVAVANDPILKNKQNHKSV